jgi:hypothetical protein
VTGTIFYARHEPPDNELPVILATTVAWRGAGLVVAVPSLQVYTTGVELLIMCRTRGKQVTGVEQVRATNHALARSLRADGRPVELLAGWHQDHGFTYQAWVPFASDAGADAPGDVLSSWTGLKSNLRSTACRGWERRRARLSSSGLPSVDSQ